jgi:hypothetical protein
MPNRSLLETETKKITLPTLLGIKYRDRSLPFVLRGFDAHDLALACQMYTTSSIILPNTYPEANRRVQGNHDGTTY